MMKLAQKDFERLAKIVHEETGNQVQEKNYSMLESRLSTHLLKLGVPTIEEYWTYFARHEDEERRTLQSLMTTHYTFFFREYVHFEAVSNWLTSELPRITARYQQNKTPVRVWSAACSRGQEVYSLAMFLEENLTKPYGIPFEILGTDIDEKSVTYGKNGVYPLKEVNTIPHHYLAYWKKGTGSIKEFAAIQPQLRSKTRFENLNLLEIPQWSEKGKFDLIFCRNVFIYFSEENIKKIALDLIQRLDPMGLFISGLSEPLRFSGWSMESSTPSVYQYPRTERHLKVAPASAVASAAPKLPAAAPVSGATAPVTAPMIPAPTVAAPPVVEAVRYKVLCVDDSPTIQALLKKIFSSDPQCSGVAVAGNGREARQKLDQDKFDLITLDIHMPEVNGMQFLETLYKRESDPPVLMISSVNRVDEDLAIRSLSLGAFDYIEKPAMNTLKKSTDEIMAKTRMALRAGQTRQKALGVESFDASIGRKIVVPDASQCVRIVFCQEKNFAPVRHVLEGQKNEYRSPALVLIVDGHSSAFDSEVLSATERTVTTLRDEKALLRPNHVYVLASSRASALLQNLSVPTVSMQIVCSEVANASHLKGKSNVQVLLDESLESQSSMLMHKLGLPLSDVTPSTSFASLSLEFFAQLRKAA